MKLQEFCKYICIALFLMSGIDVLPQRDYTDNIYGVPSSPYPIIDSVGTTYNGKVISGEYLTILGKNHTKVTKPFIFVEGIDFLNNQDFEDHIRLLNNNTYPTYNSLISQLYNNDYDVIILDFDNSTDYIQNNAMLLVKLITEIYSNNSLTHDNFVVMGYSMGGLVARYALTWMEANDQNHHTRLFVSHDSPHKGANFPLGLQELIEDIRSKTAIAWIAADILLKTFNSSMPAASQMLIYHYSNSKDGVALPSDDNLSLFTELYNLSPSTNGFPAIPLKIATSNGNYSGVTQGFLPGDKILEFNYTKDNGNLHIPWPLCGFLNFNGCTSPWAPDEISVKVRAGFDENQPLEEFSIYSLGKYPIGNTNIKVPMGGGGKQTFFSNNYSYDTAPGSFSPHFMNLLTSEISNELGVTVYSVNNTCFIPTISALDLNISIATPFDLNSSQCYTNFDYIYANPSVNKDHFSLQSGAENFVMDHVLKYEIPKQKYYYSDVDFVIPANTEVNSNHEYNKIVYNSIMNNGTFTIHSGGSSTLMAGQSIVLKPGFNIEAGATFVASVLSDNVMCESPVPFVPRRLAPGIQPDTENTSIQKIYDCGNYSEMSGYNEDLIYYGCLDSTQYNIASVDSVLTANITVYPNPTTGIFNVVFTQEIPLSEVVIRVYDYMGNLIYTIDSINTYNLDFNLPNCLPGLLTVQFDFNFGTYIYNRKILKQ